jgi:cold shock protein
MSDKLRGTVKWFNVDKGFGFIESEGKDYFVHASTLKEGRFKSLQEGDKVLFKLGRGPKGLQAQDVEII